MRVMFGASLAVFACCVLASQAAVATADTIQVTTPFDETVASDQDCSLREAIAFAAGGPASGCTARTAPGPPQIVVPAGCYELLNGPLSIEGTISIAGAGAGQASCGGGGTVIRRQQGSDRVLNNDPGAVATVSGVTLTGGVFVTGAGILNSGALTLDAVLITGNAGSSFGAGSRGAGGGAIWNTAAASLTVMDSTITGNAAGAGGSADANNPSAVGGDGGGIYNAGGLVTIVGSTISGNSAGNGGDGADFGSGGNGTDGSAGGNGGGIYNDGGTLNVERSTISGNHAGNGGSGGEGSTGGAAADGGAGGGVFSSGELTVRESTISGNRGGDGGNGGLGDTAGGGDGGFGGSGAGLRSSGIFTVITNTTLSGNTTGAGGSGGLGSPGGLSSVAGIGGGLYLPTDTGELTNVTIAGNRAGQGGAMALGNGVSVTENNSVIASNAGIDECAGGGFTDGGDNVGFGDTRCPGIHVDPKLGPLQDNGGPTPTMALLAVSPAIDLVPATSGQLCPDTDQRGVARPQGPRCDAGAYEVAPPVLANAGATATGPSSALVAVGVNAELQGTIVVVRYGTSSAYGSTSAAVRAGAGPTPVAVSVPLSGLSSATTYHAQLVATNADGSASSADLVFTTPAAAVGTASQTSPSSPVLSGVRQSARRWVEGNRMASISAKRELPFGTTFTFALSERATVTFTFTQMVAGQRVAGRCVPLSKRKTPMRRCPTTVVRGGLSLSAHQGVNRVVFQGLLARGRRLKPGTYTVVITAAVAGQPRSAPARLTFTIVGRTR